MWPEVKGRPTQKRAERWYVFAVPTDGDADFVWVPSDLQVPLSFSASRNSTRRASQPKGSSGSILHSAQGKLRTEAQIGGQWQNQDSLHPGGLSTCAQGLN